MIYVLVYGMKSAMTQFLIAGIKLFFLFGAFNLFFLQFVGIINLQSKSTAVMLLTFINFLDNAEVYVSRVYIDDINFFPVKTMFSVVI